MAKKEFTRKPRAWGLYKWTKFPSDLSKEKGKGNPNLMNKKGKKFCNAVAHSKNTEDWFVTYVYDEQIDNQGIKHRYAYVACNYVK